MSRAMELAFQTLSQRLITRLGRVALANAKATCPVQSGDLLNSLYTNSTKNSVTLGSPLDYAEHIEEGRPQVNVSGTYVSKVKRHKRRTKRGKVTVRAHTKTFQNMKPVLLSGEAGKDDATWRTLSSSPGT